MIQFDNKGIKRWRCPKSIEAAKQAKEVREAFDKKVTEDNKADARNKVRDGS